MNKSLMIFALAVATSASAMARTITVKGSDTMVVLAQKWAEVYMDQHPETKIQVNGGGTGTGFAALQDRTTSLCNASRKARSAEIANCIKSFGARPTELAVALDGLTVYVNAENPIKELTLKQLKDIFTGKVKNWKELGGADLAITVYSRENSSGTYEFFKERVLQGSDFAANVQPMQGTALILQSIGKDKTGIGYGGAGYGAGAKPLSIKKDESSPAVEPTEENIVNGNYPIWRHLFIYVNPKLNQGEIASYLNWIRSDDGQKIVKDVGYFPLPASSRP